MKPPIDPNNLFDSAKSVIDPATLRWLERRGPLSTDEVGASKEYIQATMESPTQQGDAKKSDWLNPYRLKHLAEKAAGAYISEEAFIFAAIELGYTFRAGPQRPMEYGLSLGRAAMAYGRQRSGHGTC